MIPIQAVIILIWTLKYNFHSPFAVTPLYLTRKSRSETNNPINQFKFRIPKWKSICVEVINNLRKRLQSANNEVNRWMAVRGCKKFLFSPCRQHRWQWLINKIPKIQHVRNACMRLLPFRRRHPIILNGWLVFFRDY